MFSNHQFHYLGADMVPAIQPISIFQQMKIKLLALLFFALSLGSAMSQSDETAIRQVIEAESKAFHTNADRTLFMTYWQITSALRFMNYIS